VKLITHLQLVPRSRKCGYGLDNQRLGVRFRVEVGYFSLLHNVQANPESYPASYTMGNWVYSPGGKAVGSVVPRFKMVKLYFHAPHAFTGTK
jgi:hypothetical protein